MINYPIIFMHNPCGLIHEGYNRDHSGLRGVLVFAEIVWCARKQSM